MDNETQENEVTAPAQEAFAETPAETDDQAAEQAADTGEAGEAQPTGDEAVAAFSDIEAAPDDDADAADSTSEQDVPPEEYSAFALPDGVVLQDARLESFSAWSRDVGLSQGQAQSAIDLYIRMAQEDRAVAEADWGKLASDWTARSKAAGHLTKEAMSEARAGLQSVDPDGSLSKTLATSSLDRHPAMLAVFRHYGRATSSPMEVPTAQTSGSQRAVDHAERLYPNQQKT